ncbi:MarR family transcriptional regulator [Altererythrobacter indicus]|uniref:MarR family transcriptional regulator n=1 Tax=Altericroceibacterium indicum TaxID=374177 RepID=A0A845ABS0_9SPHN|nr:MarR family winged helix-turn-helix transcriptional regulator [Altericroceibacterium indicum]MXP26693.1 MarR family transcriptional regulator [Altericroceibacterium indicum]
MTRWQAELQEELRQERHPLDFLAGKPERISQINEDATMFNLEEFLPYRLYQATERSSQKFPEIYTAKYDITRVEWRVLFNVGLYGPINSQEIVERTVLDKSKVSRAVQKLVVRGWLTRDGDKVDRRRKALQLTVEGEEILAELSARAERHNAAIIREIGSDRVEELLGLLRKIEAMDLLAEE